MESGSKISRPRRKRHAKLGVFIDMQFHWLQRLPGVILAFECQHENLPDLEPFWNQKIPATTDEESGVRSQESGVRSQESGVRSQESGVRSQERPTSCARVDLRRKSRSADLGVVGEVPGVRNQLDKTMQEKNLASNCITSLLLIIPAVALLDGLFYRRQNSGPKVNK